MPPDRKAGSRLLIDAANVIGARPSGWWKDRPGAARAFVGRVRSAVRSGAVSGPVVVVLEGASRAGAEEGVADGVTVVHAARDGDETIVRLTADGGGRAVIVSADRELRRRVEALGATVLGPRWLLDRLEGD